MKNLFRPLLPIFLLLIGLLQWPAKAQTTVESLLHGGVQRSYRLHLPPNYTGATAVPLVFNLHGYTSNALQQEFYSGMNAIADTAGFILVFPDGLNNSWNSGFQPPYYGGTDDVSFLSVLIDSLQASYNIDPARVYSCGMSNGGFMSYRLACDLEDRIAAIASVTGSMTTLQLNNCQCTRPVPVFEIHGTADATVPYLTSGLSMGIDSVMGYWSAQNNCTAPIQYDTLPNVSIIDLSTVTTQTHGGCDANSEVLLYKIENGGHTWPGAVFQIPGAVTNQDINASLEIWKFFSRFVHPNPVLTGRRQPTAASVPVVAPQPSHDWIHIMHLPLGSAISAFDMQGRRLGHWPSSETELDIDASTWPAGMYWIGVQQEGRSQVLKVVVAH
jgi:polyhydroxybutyrate depolymerase